MLRKTKQRETIRKFSRDRWKYGGWDYVSW
jgi:hypothetical protein